MIDVQPHRTRIKWIKQPSTDMIRAWNCLEPEFFQEIGASLP
jgi:hypothetical protein